MTGTGGSEKKNDPGVEKWVADSTSKDRTAKAMGVDDDHAERLSSVESGPQTFLLKCNV